MNDEEPRVGTLAPDFVLPDQNGKKHALSSYRGHWVFLYFYPHDNIPEYAEEACLIRDHFSSFERFGVNVLGVSPDDESEHRKLAEKYHLPFTLFSDAHQRIAEAYGVIAKYHVFGEREGWVMPVSFLIDLMGEIEKVYDDLNPKTQIKRVLADLERTQAEAGL